MGASASLSIGCKTTTNITNTTLNSQTFTTENVNEIFNTYREMNTAITTFNNKNKTKQTGSASVDFSGNVVSGNNNDIKVTAKVTANSVQEIGQEVVNCLSSITSLSDATLYDIMTQASSENAAAAFADATSSMSNEASSSGIGQLSLSCGIGNSQTTNINNSLTNLFQSTVINRNTTNIDRAISTMSEVQAELENTYEVANSANVRFTGNTFSGDGNKIDVGAYSESTNQQGQKVLTNQSMTTQRDAFTNTGAKSSTTISGSQSASATGSSSMSMSNSSKSEMISGTMAVVLVTAVIGVTILGKTMSKDKNADQQNQNQNPDEQNSGQPTTGQTNNTTKNNLINSATTAAASAVGKKNPLVGNIAKKIL